MIWRQFTAAMDGNRCPVEAGAALFEHAVGSQATISNLGVIDTGKDVPLHCGSLAMAMGSPSPATPEPAKQSLYQCFQDTKNPRFQFREMPVHWRANRVFETCFQVRCTESIPDGTAIALRAGIGASRDVRITNNTSIFQDDIATFSDMRFIDTCGTGGRFFTVEADIHCKEDGRIEHARIDNVIKISVDGPRKRAAKSRRLSRHRRLLSEEETYSSIYNRRHSAPPLYDHSLDFSRQHALGMVGQSGLYPVARALPHSFRPVESQPVCRGAERPFNLQERDFDPLLTDSFLAGKFGLPLELDLLREDSSWLRGPMPDIGSDMSLLEDRSLWNPSAQLPSSFSPGPQNQKPTPTELPRSSSATLHNPTATYNVASCPISDGLRIVELSPPKGEAGTVCTAYITFAETNSGHELEFGLLFGRFAPEFMENIDVGADRVAVKFRVPPQHLSGGCEVSVQALLKHSGTISRSTTICQFSYI